MKRALRNSVIVAAGFLLAACTPPEIEIAVSRVDGRLVVSLTQDWGLIFSRKKPPCVDMIDLRAGDVLKGAPAWRLESKGSQCVDVSGFSIGQVPSGFVEVVPLTAETRGTFTLLVVGIGIGEAQITLP